MIRQPAVASQFYPGDPASLKAELSSFIASDVKPEPVIGLIAPHAGYVYSGAVAGKVYGAVEIPTAVIILGPNHHGIGAAAALYPPGSWQTPLGSVPIEERLSALVRRHAKLVEEDADAHLYEHSLEVQVPFLQYLSPEIAIVPICLGFGSFSSCLELGEGIATAIREFGERVLIVASSDMTHYESADSARVKDEIALERALALDPQGLLDVCRAKRITMCGVVPATVMLVAANLLGATRARLIKYANSGEVNGDFRQVVGYAAVTVS
ncbi:MEMO1 family protein [Geobacter sp. OR-1]|uniref:AmmeMemoRadiSam system protein B n=1 Tax=Geobacter sp. OR-1 TaxID=1266765 RepID=UPI000542283E|nr:AmmeMemoRadiSam system protein B [Geobacter sp. OR-1]GAM10816.1 MEMO1 family protein [Geobacter sp. OR-1]